MTKSVKAVSLEQLEQRVKLLIINGKSQEAKELVYSLINKETVNIQALHTGYKIMLGLKDLNGAHGYLQRVLEMVPNQPVFTLEMINLLMRMNDNRSALHLLEQAADLLPDNMKYLHDVAKLYAEMDLPHKAANILRKISNALPNEIQIKYELAVAEFFQGNIETAAQLLNEVIGAKPEFASAIHIRSILKRATPTSNHVEFLRQRANPTKPQDAPVWFALAKELEDLEEFDESFAALEIANRLFNSQVNYQEDSELAALRMMKTATEALEIPRAAQAKNKVTPIFIVSLPRTGSTLLDRILSSHSEIKSLGEFQAFPRLVAAAIDDEITSSKTKLSRAEALKDIDWAQLGAAYQEDIEALADGHAYVVDKLPFNFIYTGLIKKALPHAKIIHMQRDPMDTCFAIYKTMFNQVYLYSYDQRRLARYFAAYHQLMEYWHHKMGTKLLSVSYEALVKDLESVTQKLFKQLKIEWQPELLDFHKNQAASTTASAAQVRNEVYVSSVGNWKKHEQKLQPLKLELARALGDTLSDKNAN